MLETRTRRWFTLPAAALIGLMTALAPTTVWAHRGPPFPILMDEPLVGYKVSVWTDPDIGWARFFIILESPEGGVPKETPDVSMWVEPVSHRLDRVTYEAKTLSLRDQMEFKAGPYFDQGDMWTVGFQFTDPNGATQELRAEVESTPPGIGPWGLVLYLFPFLFIGGMWGLAMRRRRQIIRLKAQRDVRPDAPEGTGGTARNLVETRMDP